eukprot:TRINITY_DN955_c0_g1_i1.p2 TRINITY_DN955_c0_g1~~TRINITY_DN955_c0_g1_i1.p2  ORF type:complete len:230 (-),score=30.37 TRINITY_DN955_c0_g1_i1:341-985(-)
MKKNYMKKFTRSKKKKVHSFPEILEGIPDIKEKRLTRKISGRFKMFEVISSDDKVSYIIKQYGDQILPKCWDKNTRARKEDLLYSLLNKKTDYVSAIEKIHLNEQKAKHIDPVSYEILMKCSGKNLLNYRNQADVSFHNLFQVFCQSIMAIESAHRLGIFHGDITPTNMFYNNSKLQLVGFDFFSTNGERVFDAELQQEYRIKRYWIYRSILPS